MGPEHERKAIALREQTFPVDTGSGVVRASRLPGSESSSFSTASKVPALGAVRFLGPSCRLDFSSEQRMTGHEAPRAIGQGCTHGADLTSPLASLPERKFAMSDRRLSAVYMYRSRVERCTRCTGSSSATERPPGAGLADLRG